MDSIRRLPKKYIALIGAVGLVILFGISTSLFAIYGNRADALADAHKGTCLTLPSLHGLTLTKQYLSQWNWEYKNKDIGLSFRQDCPTNVHDAIIEYKDQFVGFSEGPIWGVAPSFLEIKDCKGNIDLLAQAGSVFDVLINSLQVSVSLVVRSPDRTILGYSQAKNFFSNNIEVRGVGGNVVARLSRQIIAVPWEWKFEVINATHPAADSRLLLLLAGKTAFMGKKTDACNNYFWVTSFTMIALVAVLVVGAVGGTIYYFFCRKQSTDGAHHSM